MIKSTPRFVTLLRHLSLSATLVATILAQNAKLQAAAPLPPTGLKINNLFNPLGVDCEVPLRFAWQMESKRRSEVQTAYRVVVARTAKTAKAGTGDVWDGGKVMSDEQTGIVNGGRIVRRGSWV